MIRKRFKAVFLAAAVLAASFIWPGQEAAAAETKVVVLDPGHDDFHSGAAYHGKKEQDLTLKIAQSVKKYLEEYEGVSVYMTRTDSSCPDRTSLRECLHARVDAAAEKKADLFVSLHLNASTSSSARGAEVYAEGDHYRPELGLESRKLGASILNQLNGQLGIGIRSGNTEYRGVAVTYNAPSSDPEFTYPNGTTANYYSVVRNSTKAGFPGIIVEHAFLSNSSDYQSFLSTDDKLDKIGKADADGIAAYLGLHKQGETPEEPTEPPTEPSEPEGEKPSWSIPEEWKEVEGETSFLHGFAPGTTVDGVINSIQVKNGTVSVLRNNGKALGNLRTGDILRISDTDGITVYEKTMILYGDVNGDGRLTSVDMLIGQRGILGLQKLTAAAEEAADVNHDGRLRSVDLLLMQRHVLGIQNIAQ